MPTNKEQELKVSHNTMDRIQYRFICERKVNFGQAVYIVGNIEQLGEWDINCAIRLDCYLSKYWIIDVQIPIDTQIQYKFFVSSYEHHFNQYMLEISSQNWIGDVNKMNFKLFICRRDAKKIQQSRKSKQLRIMSFNIRCQTEIDQGELHWNNRRQNCFEVIKQSLPSIIGVQQVTPSQKSYLSQKLSNLYNYVGTSRYVYQEEEEVGIFYDKQRFLVVQYGFKWISQSRVPGSIGFGASFPRYYTYMILEDTYTSQKLEKIINKVPQQIQTWIPRNLIMVINVHLDHESGLARQKGVEMMAGQIQSKRQQYKDQLKDIFVFGDFNTYESPQVFQRFYDINTSLESTRRYFERKNLRDFCDYGYTFNGFRKDEQDTNKQINLIDHLFIHNEVYKPSEFQVIRQMIHKPKNPKYCHVSDHFPILGIFKPISHEV